MSGITLQTHNGINVLRDDLLTGGTKSRFLHNLLPQAYNEFVYCSPVYGGFQIALAAVCKQLGKKATIFCAYRKQPHANTLKAKELGATVYQVKHGYLSHVESKARQYCANTGAYKLTFGADYPQAIDAIADTMRQVSAQLGFEPKRVWCALGSGTLTKGILRGTDQAQVNAVQVGKETNLLCSRLVVHKYPKTFDKAASITPPFPSCANYDAKAWELLQNNQPNSSDLFWNVL